MFPPKKVVSSSRRLFCTCISAGASSSSLVSTAVLRSNSAQGRRVLAFFDDQNRTQVRAENHNHIPAGYSFERPEFVISQKYDLLIEKCRFSRSDIEAKQFHSDAIKNGFFCDLFMGNTLINAYARSGDLQSAHHVKEDDESFFLPLDFQHFKKVYDVEEFYLALEKKPKDALLCMSAALHKVLFTKEDMKECAKIRIHLHNYQESMIALKNLKAAYIGKSKGKNQALYYLYLEVVSITNSKSQSVPEDAQHTDMNGTSSENLDLYSFSPLDLEFIVKFSEEHDSDVFCQILQSICPCIFGYELVKGILRTIAINLLHGPI
ncbi:hypothetical protein C2S51_034056 [Perilla frutescens var. frutescens]|nr:hypothetical protein C2S51_034056 [Perilla frutescens var. frutescens]